MLSIDFYANRRSVQSSVIRSNIDVYVYSHLYMCPLRL